MKRKLKRWIRIAGIWFLTASAAVQAASLHEMIGESGEAVIVPASDSGGRLLLRGDGYYCLKSDGSAETSPGVVWFDHVKVGNTTFHGYYYHDETGKFRAGDPHLVWLQDVRVTTGQDDTAVFSGCYMAGNLGKLSAAPQVRYIDQVTVNNVTYDGYYYFNEYGRLVTDPGVHEVHMVSSGRWFDGEYYFGGTNGALSQSAGVTPDGLSYDRSGRLLDIEVAGMEALEDRLKDIRKDLPGDWGIYVRDLKTEEEIALDAEQVVSASLIKLFVMERTYAYMDEVTAHASALSGKGTEQAAADKIHTLLSNMISYSDNESFNELVRLQSEKHDFLDGCALMNEYLEEQGYEDTSVRHTLQPAESASEGLNGGSESNMTSAADCGRLLERIYRKKCVSRKASEEMLGFLLEQTTLWKIPSGLPEGTKAAGKSGETDNMQHDAFIVYGDVTDYILCITATEVPGEEETGRIYKTISDTVYQYLNRQT